MGLDVELDHGLHLRSRTLKELPDYYTRLATMEAEARQDHAG
jgi:hypothetical protein